jgi:hypothetical protein
MNASTRPAGPLSAPPSIIWLDGLGGLGVIVERSALRAPRVPVIPYLGEVEGAS